MSSKHPNDHLAVVPLPGNDEVGEVDVDDLIRGLRSYATTLEVDDAFRDYCLDVASMMRLRQIRSRRKR